MSENIVATKIKTWIANNSRRIEWYQDDIDKEVDRLNALFHDPEKDRNALVYAIRSEVPGRVKEIDTKMMEIKRLVEINESLSIILEETGVNTAEEQPEQ